MARRAGLSIKTTIYNRFHGADFSSDPSNVNPKRSPYCINMISDEGGMPEKRLGWRTMYRTTDARVNGIYTGKFGDVTKFLAHIGRTVWTWNEGDETPTQLLSNLYDGPSQGVPLGGCFWIVTGGELLKWDGETVTDVARSDTAYIPTTVISRDPAGGGRPYEDINLVGRYRRNLFLADGTSTEYVLDDTADAEGDITVKVNGVTVDGWTADRAAGKITFDTAPEAPEAGQADNVEITYPHTVNGYADKIRKCTIITAYGVNSTDRVVLSGNPDYPNMDWTSGLNDPTYIPDLRYATVGLESSPIMGYVRMGSSLGIVKAPHPQDSTVFLRSGTIDSNGEVQFTQRAALAGVGAVSKRAFAAMPEEPVLLAGTGVYALTTSLYTAERIAQQRSYFLNGALMRQDRPDKAHAVVWRGMYLLSFPDGSVYVLDGTQAKSYRYNSANEYSYEGYYWDNIPATCFCVQYDGPDEHLWFGTSDGRICRFNTDYEGMARYSDDGEPIRAVWATKVDDDGDATVQKTMIKRGAGVTIKPHARTSAQVWVLKDEDVERLAASGSWSKFSFEDCDFDNFSFDTYDGPRDLMMHTKVKKYKRLQFVVINEEKDQGFGIFAVTKHYVAGNFAKQ